MNQSIETEIEQYEERLKEAMVQGDVSTLNELIATDLVFTNHFGQIMTKQDDLHAHQSGLIKIDTITLSEMMLHVYEDLAIVSVKAHIVGSFSGASSESDFRFTRVWSKLSTKNWQIIAGHSSVVT